MPYAIITTDRADAGELRQQVRAEHLAYLDAHKQKLLAAGAKIADDGSGGSGSILLVDTDDRAEAEAFIANDPFALAGLFQSIEVVRWRKAFFAGENLL
ncbi:MAG: YciI family protein [Geminicoccaceae bacterium]|nr:MAG: YciI family protein [Geminicoccaceae bacterium]